MARGPADRQQLLAKGDQVLLFPSSGERREVWVRAHVKEDSDESKPDGRRRRREDRFELVKWVATTRRSALEDGGRAEGED